MLNNVEYHPMWLTPVIILKRVRVTGRPELAPSPRNFFDGAFFADWRRRMEKLVRSGWSIFATRESLFGVRRRRASFSKRLRSDIRPAHVEPGLVREGNRGAGKSSFRAHGSEVMSACFYLALPIKTLYSGRPNSIRLAPSSRRAQSVKLFLIQQRSGNNTRSFTRNIIILKDIVFLAERGIP